MNSRVREKSINVFTFLLVVATLCAMGACYWDNIALRWASYASELLLIGYAILNSHNISKSRINLQAVLFASIVIVLNNLLSPNEPQFANLIKLAGYFCCYYYGTTLARRYDSLSVDSNLLFALILVPVLVVAFFDHTIFKNAFFTTSNTFVYTGLSMTLFYALVKYKKRHFMLISWAVVAFYVLICTSLGVVVAILLAYMILNLKASHLPYLFFAGIIVILAVAFIDIPLFIRIRDVISLWLTMSSDDWKNLQTVNYYELNQRVDIAGDRGDVGSSIWRLAQWSGIFTEYVRRVWTIPFGMGSGFSISFTGLLPHNDFLMILSEYGLILFCMFVKFIMSIYNKMRNERYLIYFVLAMFIYHLTENLMLTFPPNALFYFVLGWCAIKYNKKVLI